MTGVSGLLGRYLVLGRDPDTEIHGISRHSWPQDRLGTCQMHEVDVTSTRALTSVLDAIQPDVIVHAAAEGRVDAVEGNADAYRPLNVEVSRDLAQYSAAAGIQYVFISSNAVFGGAPTPYSDDSPFDPVNDYGRLKAEAEVAVSSVNGDALIVRPILMYGWPYPEHRLNPVVRVGQGAQGRQSNLCGRRRLDSAFGGVGLRCGDLEWHSLEDSWIGECERRSPDDASRSGGGHERVIRSGSEPDLRDLERQPPRHGTAACGYRLRPCTA